MAERDIKTSLQEATKAAMRAKDQRRLNVLRLMSAAIRQKEIDIRPQIGDQPLAQQEILVVLDKMLKQRRESFAQYQAAERQDLAEQEAYEITVVEEFLPDALSELELDGLIKNAIDASAAVSDKDMGKVMTILKPQIQGRADMKIVSDKIKAKLKELLS
jgi:hypothetical protein